MHLLRHVRGGVPGGRHRVDDPLRPDRPEPRADDVRQGKVVERFRRDGAAGNGPGPHAGRTARAGVRGAAFGRTAGVSRLVEPATPAGLRRPFARKG
ncbi:MAG TPA: hypothetical protein VM533_15950 [Fimbriiglobus sp.]|nr:hypothetical protein [Fimbriiglobus sp.]